MRGLSLLAAALLASACLVAATEPTVDDAFLPAGAVVEEGEEVAEPTPQPVARSPTAEEPLVELIPADLNATVTLHETVLVEL
jgi:hypothetical protein